ncbi:MAG: hypothetical protein IKO07_10815 [Clostridia bacterium]|nr:hypothetical protein [Clostridia bacterium]
MIKQHIYRRDTAGYRTVAASAGLTGSAWLSLLEQQTMLRCQSNSPAPVYYQYPLGYGLVLSRCAVDPNGRHGSCLMHQLVMDEPADIEALSALRPIAAAHFREAYAGRGDEIELLPTLKPESLADAALLSAGFRLIDGWFGEARLARLIAAVLRASRDKRYAVHIVIDQESGVVSERGRLLMDMLMRALPVEAVQRVSYCTLMSPDETAMPYSVFISRPEAGGADRGAAAQCVRFDMSLGKYQLPENAPVPDERCLETARALLAHDIQWIGRVRRDGAQARLNAAASLKLDIPPFEPGMSLTQYVQDWLEALETRRDALNGEAFREFARAEWPRLTERVIRAGDVMSGGEFVRQLRGSIVALCKGRRGEQLGMSKENLRDLVVILLDSISWDDVDLDDPEDARVIKSATGYASLLDDASCGAGTLLACRVMHGLLDAPASYPVDGMDDMARLSEEDPTRFKQVQACGRRYVASRCRAFRAGRDPFGLVDDLFTAAAVLGYARFEGGIPDFRQLDKVQEKVAEVAGEKAGRRFEERLDRMRRRMHASRANRARRRELRLMLIGSLALALVIIGVIVSYFVFVRK